MEAMAARGMMGSGQDGMQGRDPLGRQPGSTGTGFGDHIKVPDHGDLQRAREILEELQRRSGEQDRPDIELEYLDRLLKRF